jgi:membrane associated rhomboid family serine protease
MFDNLVSRFKSSSIVGKYIYANVALFVFVVLIAVFSLLLNSPGASDSLVRCLELPASPGQLIRQPWSLFTYMFLHADFWHILWNMIALNIFGKVFLNLFSVRHFVGFYILGGLFGGLFYVLALNLFPYFAPLAPHSYLLGASASVLSVAVASAVRAPGYRLNLLFFGSVKLSTIAVVTVLVSFLMITGENPGGNFAHLGGAFAGWLVSTLLAKGIDLTSVVNKPIDLLSTIFKKRPHRAKKKGKFKFTASSGSAKHASDYSYNAGKKADEAEIDRILEKIKKGGYASLSDQEKKRLFDASNRH